MEPLSDLQDRVVEETFMNGLLPWIKAEVDFCRPVDVAQMVHAAQLVENREIIHNEANLKGYAQGKYPPQGSRQNTSAATVNDSDNKRNTLFSMRTITLRTTSREVKRGAGKAIVRRGV